MSKMKPIKNLHNIAHLLGCVCTGTMYHTIIIFLLLWDYMFCGQHPYCKLGSFPQVVVNHHRSLVTTSFYGEKKRSSCNCLVMLCMETCFHTIYIDLLQLVEVQIKEQGI